MVSNIFERGPSSSHSNRGEVWAHKTRLTQPPFTEVHRPSQERKRSCISVLEVSILTLFVFAIGYWNCSDTMVFFTFHFYQNYPVICTQILEMYIRF